MEQTGRTSNKIINGVAEIYAERGTENDSIQNESPKDTVNSVCTVIAESFGVSINPSDIQAAYRLKSKRPGPRPILVAFNSYTTRQSMVKSRGPRQRLTSRISPIYINDHLTEVNANLFSKSK